MAESESSQFEHLRHKAPWALEREREAVAVCAPLRSQVNLARIVRVAGGFGLRRVICCGNAKVRAKVARDAATTVEIEVHRTLPPVLKRLREEGYTLIGVEQSTGASCLYDFEFPRRAALVFGNERLGLSPEELAYLDQVVEIPVYGLPYSFNVATSAAMVLYAYCRQYPKG